MSAFGPESGEDKMSNWGAPAWVGDAPGSRVRWRDTFVLMLVGALLGGLGTWLFTGSGFVPCMGAYCPKPTPSIPQAALLFRHEQWPPSDLQIVQDMPGSSVLYYSGSQFTYEGQTCAESSNLCVLIDTFSGARQARLTNVLPGQGFLEGRTGWSDLQELDDKFASYWDGRNCTSAGCQYVHVYLFSDGQLEHQWWLQKPPR